MPAQAFVGTAGWVVPARLAARAPGPGTHLERYARVLNAVEINSTFHRAHQPATYARWAASVPAGFRFAVKLRRTITHERRLREAGDELARFVDEIAGLGDRLGVLLVQLPPSLAFDRAIAERFFARIRMLSGATVVCEPRHGSWFGGEAESLLRDLRVARVAADPAPVPEAAEPGGSPGLVYYRLHGSPRRYYSAYPAEFLEHLAARIRTAARCAPVWCIFDNTAAGAAFENALDLRARLAG
jgi:uncharacterized protein YecE (DUF72 family)